MFVELQNLMKSNKVRGTQMVFGRGMHGVNGGSFLTSYMLHCSGNLYEFVAALLDWEMEI